MRRHLIGAALVLLFTSAAAFAQQTTGNITGRILDQQSAAVPGATVTAKNPATGFTRSEASDSEGVYRLTGLPVGTYDITAELQGFTTADRKNVPVTGPPTLRTDFPLRLGSIAE